MGRRWKIAIVCALFMIGGLLLFRLSLARSYGQKLSMVKWYQTSQGYFVMVRTTEYGWRGSPVSALGNALSFLVTWTEPFGSKYYSGKIYIYKLSTKGLERIGQAESLGLVGFTQLGGDVYLVNGNMNEPRRHEIYRYSQGKLHRVKGDIALPSDKFHSYGKWVEDNPQVIVDGVTVTLSEERRMGQAQVEIGGKTVIFHQVDVRQTTISDAVFKQRFNVKDKMINGLVPERFAN